MAISYTQNGITFDNITNGEGKLPSKYGNANNDDFSFVQYSGIYPFVNAVEIDWNGAKMADTTVNTTGELLKIIDELYKKVNDVKVSAIILKHQETMLNQQETLYTTDKSITVTAEVYPVDATIKTVEWSCSDNENVSFSSTSALTTNISFSKYGQGTIYCKSTDGSGIQTSFKIWSFDPTGTTPPGFTESTEPPTEPPTGPKETEPPTPDPSTPTPVKVSEITLSQTGTWSTDKLNSTITVTATVSPSNATNQKVIWSSSNYEVVNFVSQDSKTVTIKVVDYGNATIYCKATDGSDIQTSFEIYAYDRNGTGTPPSDATQPPTVTTETTTPDPSTPPNSQEQDTEG